MDVRRPTLTRGFRDQIQDLKERSEAFAELREGYFMLVTKGKEVMYVTMDEELCHVTIPLGIEEVTDTDSARTVVALANYLHAEKSATFDITSMEHGKVVSWQPDLALCLSYSRPLPALEAVGDGLTDFVMGLAGTLDEYGEAFRDAAAGVPLAGICQRFDNLYQLAWESRIPEGRPHMSGGAWQMPEVAEVVRDGVRLLVERNALTDMEEELLLLAARGAMARRALDTPGSEDDSPHGGWPRLERMARDGTLAREELLEGRPALVMSMVNRIGARGRATDTDGIIRAGTKALVRAVERQSVSSTAVGDGRAVCDQIMREVRWAVRNAAARALCDASRVSGAGDFERREEGGEGQVEVIPLESASESDTSYSDETLKRILEEESLEEIRKRIRDYRPRLWEIIEFRFGLKDGEPHNLDETAAEFGITRERVRQMEGGFFSRGFTVDQNGKIVRKTLQARRPLRDYVDDGD